MLKGVGIVICLHFDSTALLVQVLLLLTRGMGKLRSQKVKLRTEIWRGLRDGHWLNRFVEESLLVVPSARWLLAWKSLERRGIGLVFLTACHRCDSLQISFVGSLGTSSGGGVAAYLTWVLLISGGWDLVWILKAVQLHLLLIGLLYLELELLIVVVGDKSRWNQALRVKLGGRENHLIWWHKKKLIR